MNNQQGSSGYLKFIAENPHLLAFGFALTFASSLGQTFFIGSFGPSILKEFELSHTAWGSIYMTGTIMSALCLPFTGQLIDRFPLKIYTIIVVSGLCISGLFISFNSSFWLLIPIIFCLRHTGQGLTSHVAITTMARHFSKGRGKAVALASLGYAFGESFLPLIVVIAIGVFGWRTTYGITSILLGIGIIPLILWLLRKSLLGPQGTTNNNNVIEKISISTARSWTRREMLSDWRFYLVLPAVVAPSFIGTALFFHHLTLAEAKNWSAVWFTGSYWIYAVGSMTASLTFGPVIDRMTAIKSVPFFLMPKICALIIIWAFNDPIWAWPYLLLLGLNVGMTYTGLTALWAELYGPKHLGAIRSLIVAITVLASALGPPVMGFMIDTDISMGNICIIFAIYCVIATIFIFVGLRSTETSIKRHLGS
tara:strand:+ start:10967 stop:12235 length:1269 start_codon:yes stop_codon:yes gene_type:complete